MSNDPTQEVNEGGAAEMAQQDELEALRAEVEQLRAQSLLERADLENQRKRIARDIEQARKFANERLLGDLLPVFDSLDALENHLEAVLLKMELDHQRVHSIVAWPWIINSLTN